LEFLDNRITEVENLIKDSKVTTPSSGDHIDFGHNVTVVTNSNQVTFKIVGEPEADPKQRLISHQSPLGLALMGKKVGDEVEVDAPIGKIVYKVVAIS